MSTLAFLHGVDPWIFAFSFITVAVTLGMGFWSARKSKTASDFFVAGRSVSVGWNASAISGEYLSAASFMGIAGMVMSSGYDALWYPVCYACGYLFLLLFIAGLQDIDPALYDAAEVDGANSWQKLIHVTLPGLREVMTFVMSLAMINGLKGFATVFVMTNGGPFHQSELITTYIYRLAFQAQDHGLAAVLCILLSLFAITITVVFNRWRARMAR